MFGYSNEGIQPIILDGLCIERENSEKREFGGSDYEIDFGYVEFECM